MPFFTRGEANIHYEEFGTGYPVLLFSPGLMRSTVERWDHMELRPRDVLTSGYRLIARPRRRRAAELGE